MQRPEESLSYCFSGIVHLDLCFGDSVCHSSGTRLISWAGWPVSSRDLLSLLPRMLCHVWLPPTTWVLEMELKSSCLKNKSFSTMFFSLYVHAPK